MPEELFAFQVPHPATNNCIATAVWHHPINLSQDEIQHYEIFANAINVSRDTIITGTSNDSQILASVVYLSGCMKHVITVCEVNICDRRSPKSHPYPLEQCPMACDTVTTRSDAGGTTCAADGRNGKSNIISDLLTLL